MIYLIEIYKLSENVMKLGKCKSFSFFIFDNIFSQNIIIISSPKSF